MIQPLVFEIFIIKKTGFWKKFNKYDFFEKESTYLERRKNTADLCFCFGYLNQSCVRIGSCDGADGEFPGMNVHKMTLKGFLHYIFRKYFLKYSLVQSWKKSSRN